MAKKKKSTAPRTKRAAPRSKGEVVEPHYAMRLAGIVGITRAARMIGVSTSLLNKARENSLVSKVVEIACKGVLASLTNQAPSEDVALRAVAKKNLNTTAQREERAARRSEKEARRPAKTPPPAPVRAAHPGDLPPAAAHAVDLPPDKLAALEAFVQALGGQIVTH